MSASPDLSPEGIAARKKAQEQRAASSKRVWALLLVPIVAVVGFLVTRSASGHDGSAKDSGIHTKRVTATAFGADWPLVDSVAVLGCQQVSTGKSLTLFAGKTYGLNGTALDLGLPEPSPALFKGHVADVSALFPVAEGLC